MKRYRRYRNLVTIGIATYVVAAIAMPLATGRHEAYPLFDWNLYSRVPNRIVEYELCVVLDADDDSRCLATVRKRSRPDRRRVSEREIRPLLRHVGAALESGDAETVEESWRIFEFFLRARMHLGRDDAARELTIRIERVVFDPLERYRSGRLRERTVLAERRFGVTT